ncbi:MAG: ribosome assembly cofactor RimP [Flavobacteriaceae bacterium]|nr:MAG: ribosome assembly cofactor RimP [Flavobacteriaceae bacterium]
MDKEIIKRLVDEALEESENLYLIELSFLDNSKILVEIDGDTGVNLKECIRINRYVEQNLDREEEDFSLEVTSVDITKPLKVLRQYIKNIGKTLKVKMVDNQKFEGILKSVEDNEISLEWKAREPKPIGKGKVTVDKKAVIAYKNIQEAKVKIIF